MASTVRSTCWMHWLMRSTSACSSLRTACARRSTCSVSSCCATCMRSSTRWSTWSVISLRIWWTCSWSALWSTSLTSSFFTIFMRWSIHSSMSQIVGVSDAPRSPLQPSTRVAPSLPISFHRAPVPKPFVFDRLVGPFTHRASWLPVSLPLPQRVVPPSEALRPIWRLGLPAVTGRARTASASSCCIASMRWSICAVSTLRLMASLSSCRAACTSRVTWSVTACCTALTRSRT
mmetsp:Transcript_76380/g.210929  ORF Transcript_76380/g.210929 Transcript_76380/m.210929 type:complete len:233 (-) Transcript_76380:1366-2064(-)